MLQLNFISWIFGAGLSLIFTLIWGLYFFFLRGATSKYINVKDKLTVKKSTITLQLNFVILLNFFKFSYLYLCSFIYFFKSFNTLFCFKHVSFEPLTINMYCLVLSIFFILICIFEKFFFSIKNLTAGVDFFIALWLFFIFTPFSIFANTLLTMFFFLEFGSISTMYLLVSAKDFFNFGLKKKLTPTTFFNSIFFQFWASFFSSILMVYSIINFFYIFGSTEWVTLNLLLEVSFTRFTGTTQPQMLFILYLFVFAVLIKMGVSPLFFFKIEVYKGLPLIILFFYSVLYFFFFFVLVFLVFLYYFFIVVFFLSVLIFFFLAFSIIIFTINLFNLYLLKNFFAMSSLINASVFFFLIFFFAI